ncbi:MAG TPA: c-type cytochrome [Chloroflexia bacterium]|nr:c-type cytochrome [Chloroflexia bacterium]
MSTRMILSISFALFVVLGMVVYVLYDNSRADTTMKNTVETGAESGAKLFAANCSQCHGPQGEGAIGPALNRDEWHADNPKYDENSVTSFIRNVLQRGQYSPQPGIQMPAWSKDYGGPLNEEQIEDLITFITHPDWTVPLRYTAAPNFLADIPANDAQKQQYPSTTAEVLAVKFPDKYGKLETRTAQQKQQLADDAKADDTQKGPASQEAATNREALRKILGNRDPNNPGEKLTGLKQMLQTKGCINCHTFGSAGSTLGPNLTEVGSRRTAQWLNDWIKNPSAMPSDQRGPNLMPWFKDDKRTDFWPMKPTFMPTIQMTDQERQQIVDYLSGLHVAPVVLPQPSGQSS